jgi:arylsulfatase A-like enzyme/Tfp pilus assembly protein PilF
MRVIIRLLFFVTLAVSGLASQSDAPKTDATAKPALPNIILITVDTTRADRMGFLGSKRGLTPNLDALAKDGAVFTRAYSQAPLTPASHASILTGTFPQYHQVLTFLIPLAKDMPYMPEILQQRGYSTGAFVGSLALDPLASVPGFDRGFDKYGAGYSWQSFTPETRYQTVEHRAAVVVKDALDWVGKQHSGPFFLWVHIYDPHAPYDPPEPYKTRYAKQPYDGEIAYADAQLGNFFKKLKAAGLYDNTLIAMTADHGESLGAHGENEHGVFVYDETIRVPLLIKMPGKSDAGKRIDNRVELVDIMPTVLQSIDIPVPEKVQGQSLLGFLTPGTPEGDAAAHAWHDRGAYSQADYGHVVFAWSALQSLRAGKYMYIQAPRRELYEDAVDPNAQNNLASSSPAVADALSSRLQDFQKLTTNTGETPKFKLDAKNVAKLAALGYMAPPGEPTMKAGRTSWPDPKDKIHVANVVLYVNNIVETWRCKKGIDIIKKSIAADPEIAMLHFQLGGCYLELHEDEKAIPEVRKTVEIDPAFLHAYVNLGRAYLRTHHAQEATEAFERALKIEPNLMEAHVFLVVTYAALDRVADEIKECRRVLEVVPDHYGANLNLGRFLAESGDLQGAIAPLEKATSLRPTQPAPHHFLSEVYEKLGRSGDAERERDASDRLAEAMGAMPPGNAGSSDVADPH